MMIKEGKGGKMNKGKKPETHTITITVKKGNFTYVNPLVWVDQGDTIIWKCTNRCPFAIHIGRDSPLKKGRFRSAQGKSIKTEVPKKAPPGNYEYTVAVYLDGNIWTDDPPFIVKRP